MKKTTFLLLSWVAIQTLAAQSSITLKSATGLPFLSTREGRSVQSAELTLENSGDSTTVSVKVAGLGPQPLEVAKGSHSLEIFFPQIKQPTTTSFSIESNGTRIATGEVKLEPVRPMTIY